MLYPEHLALVPTVEEKLSQIDFKAKTDLNSRLRANIVYF